MNRTEYKQVFELMEMEAPAMPKAKHDHWVHWYWKYFGKGIYKKDEVMSALKYIRDAGQHRDKWQPPDIELIDSTIAKLKPRKKEIKIEEAPVEARPDLVNGFIKQIKDRLSMEQKHKTAEHKIETKFINGLHWRNVGKKPGLPGGYFCDKCDCRVYMETESTYYCTNCNSENRGKVKNQDLIYDLNKTEG